MTETSVSFSILMFRNTNACEVYWQVVIVFRFWSIDLRCGRQRLHDLGQLRARQHVPCGLVLCPAHPITPCGQACGDGWRGLANSAPSSFDSACWMAADGTVILRP